MSFKTLHPFLLTQEEVLLAVKSLEQSLRLADNYSLAEKFAQILQKFQSTANRFHQK